MVKPIEASGGVVVRLTPEGLRILVVHRPRYDDWTFPKGKNEPGEDSLEAALREISEETGQRPRPISMLGETTYPVNGIPKLVRWYGMRVAEPGLFVPNEEVDEVRWLDPEEVPGLLTYHHDRQMLERVDLDALLTTGTLYLVRHGAAGDRQSWSGDDSLRPLSRRGELQASGLAKTLANHRIEAIFTSPYTRCVQTVEPLAETTGLEVVEHPALAEGEGGKGTRELVRSLIGTNAVLCSHGDVIPAVMEWMVNKGMTLKSDFDCRKGSTWEITVRGGVFHKAHYLPPLEA